MVGSIRQWTIVLGMWGLAAVVTVNVMSLHQARQARLATKAASSAPLRWSQTARSTDTRSWHPGARLGVGGASQAVGVSRGQCFPVETLPPALRSKAETLLLRALDGEALYTLVGGVKPMSSGWLALNFDLAKPDPEMLDEHQQIVRALRCGEEISAHLTAFARSYEGKRPLQGTFFHRASLQKMVKQRAPFWNGFAIGPQSEPLEILLATEYAPASSRFRGYGYLFGYPSRAVDFFVTSSEQQDTDPQHKLVPRDFLSVPTFSRDQGAFVYAVPKGAPLDAEDLALRARCAPILKEYQRRRALYIGPGKKGVVALLRDWYDNGQGRCSPRFARF